MRGTLLALALLFAVSTTAIAQDAQQPPLPVVKCEKVAAERTRVSQATTLRQVDEAMSRLNFFPHSDEDMLSVYGNLDAVKAGALGAIGEVFPNCPK